MSEKAERKPISAGGGSCPEVGLPEVRCYFYHIAPHHTPSGG